MIKKLNTQVSWCLFRMETQYFALLLAWHPPVQVYRYRCWVKWPKNNTWTQEELQINSYFMVRLSGYQMILSCFLSSDRNKEQLCHMLKNLEHPWSSLPIIEMFNCKSSCWGKSVLLQVFNLQIDMAEIFSLHSNQEKNDTCFILCINHAKMIGFKNVVIHSSDTDRFLSSYAMLVMWTLPST